MSSEAGREALYEAARERCCSMHSVARMEVAEASGCAAAAQLAYDSSPAKDRLALLQA